VTASGCTIVDTERQSLHMRDSQTQGYLGCSEIDNYLDYRVVIPVLSMFVIVGLKLPSARGFLWW